MCISVWNVGQFTLVGPFTKDQMPEHPGVYYCQNHTTDLDSPAMNGIFRKFDGRGWMWGYPWADYAGEEDCPTAVSEFYWWGITESDHNHVKTRKGDQHET